MIFKILSSHAWIHAEYRHASCVMQITDMRHASCVMQITDTRCTIINNAKLLENCEICYCFKLFASIIQISAPRRRHTNRKTYRIVYLINKLMKRNYFIIYDGIENQFIYVTHYMLHITLIYYCDLIWCFFFMKVFLCERHCLV